VSALNFLIISTLAFRRSQTTNLVSV